MCEFQFLQTSEIADDQINTLIKHLTGDAKQVLSYQEFALLLIFSHFLTQKLSFYVQQYKVGCRGNTDFIAKKT